MIYLILSITICILSLISLLFMLIRKSESKENFKLIVLSASISVVCSCIFICGRIDAKKNFDSMIQEKARIEKFPLEF